MPVYKDEKTNTWYFSCYYKDWQGQQKRKLKRGFALQREAKQAEHDFLAKMTSDSNMKFSALCEYYIEDCKKRLKQNTSSNREYCINHVLLPVFAKFPINEITPQTIRNWQNQLLGSNYKQSTIKQYNIILSTIFNYAVKYYGLKSNPLRIAGTIGKAKRQDISFWTLEEFNKFCDAIESDNKDYKYKARTEKTLLLTAYKLLFFSGLRCGELLALTVGDFNVVTNTITVNKTLSRLKAIDVITTPKTDKSNRKVILPPTIASMLNEYINSCLYDPDSTDRIFPTLTEPTLLNNLKYYAGLAALKEITVHDLRHSHASLLIHLDVNILAISERLGHENIQTTLNIYTHIYQKHKEDVAQKLESLVN